jgi:hypothetical protein
MENGRWIVGRLLGLGDGRRFSADERNVRIGRCLHRELKPAVFAGESCLSLGAVGEIDEQQPSVSALKRQSY